MLEFSLGDTVVVHRVFDDANDDFGRELQRQSESRGKGSIPRQFSAMGTAVVLTKISSDVEDGEMHSA